MRIGVRVDGVSGRLGGSRLAQLQARIREQALQRRQALARRTMGDAFSGFEGAWDGFGLEDDPERR